MTTIYELMEQATPGPFEAVIHLGRAQVIRGGDGGWIAEFEHVPDFDKSAANAALLAHCRNHFLEALEALKQQHEEVIDSLADEGFAHPGLKQPRRCTVCDLIKKLETVT